MSRILDVYSFIRWTLSLDLIGSLEELENSQNERYWEAAEDLIDLEESIQERRLNSVQTAA